MEVGYDSILLTQSSIITHIISLAGLKSLEVQREQSTGEQTQKRKVRRSRAIKITNTHLKDIDLTVDYKHPHESKKPC